MAAAPQAGAQNHSVVVLDGNDILGVMGATPVLFHSHGRILRGAELTTWIVAPQARGQGVGRRILQYLQARYEVLLGAGISAAALPLYLKAGFAHLAHIPRFFHISDFDTIGRFVDCPAAALDLTQARQSMAAECRWQARACAAADLAPLALGANQILRDAARLDWRHDAHPVFHYEGFAVRDAGAGAGVILRQDRAAETPILHLVDLFGDAADLPAAVAFVEAEAARRGAAFVDFTATSGALGGVIRARGWSSAVDDPLVALPSLFHPVELRIPPTTSLVIWAAEDQARLYDFSQLHLTKADLDMDRPTLAYIEAAGA